MLDTNKYKESLDSIFGRVVEIIAERSDLDAELAKLTQLMHATANMLPDAERNAIINKWTNLLQAQLNRETSLTDAVRNVLREAGREWLTVAKVRDRLFSSGFDFTAYLSNPLSSVSTTLARLKKDEVETTTIEGVTAYRWKARKGLPSPSARLSSDGPPTREQVLRGMGKLSDMK